MNNAQAPHGHLAYTFCRLSRPLQVLRSAGGYYIGTCTEDGQPISRESNEYFVGKDIAQDALQEGNWSQRLEP